MAGPWPMGSTVAMCPPRPVTATRVRAAAGASPPVAPDGPPTRLGSGAGVSDLVRCGRQVRLVHEDRGPGRHWTISAQRLSLMPVLTWRRTVPVTWVESTVR